MNLTSKAIIKNLNDRILAQSVIMETLIDIILDKGLITEKELEKMILENQESQQEYIKELRQKESSSIPISISKTDFENDSEFLEGLYFGPVGEA